MLTIRISYSTVIDELSRTAAYAGVKRDDYQRLCINQADSDLLQSMCQEACNSMTQALKAMVQDVTATDRVYTVQLRTSAAFDSALSLSITGSLQSYVALSVLSRWLALSKCDASSDFAAVAKTMLDDAKRQIMQKRRPVRPSTT